MTFRVGMPKPRTLLFLLVLLLLISPFLYFVTIYYQTYDIISGINIYQPNLATKVYDVNGQLISEIFDENRTFVDIKKVPKHVIRAFVASEDRSFYKHRGFDVKAILRALVIDVFKGEIRQGGSTITQQLVKKLYTRGERTFRRKLIELFIAKEFEKMYSKDQIMEMYLNLIYFGHGTYGINSAARFYFDCGAEDLTPVQSAVLASMIAAPNRYSPLRNPEESHERSKQVLYSMIEEGFITRDDAISGFYDFWARYLDSIKLRFPTLGVRNRKNDLAPHFTEYIRRIMVQQYGEDKLYREGLSIHTTLDLRIQKAAEETLRTGLEKQKKITALYNRSKFLHFDTMVAERYSPGKKLPPRDLKARVGTLSHIRNELVDEMDLCGLLFDMDDMAVSSEKYLEEYDWFRSSGGAEGAIVALEPQTGHIAAMIGGSEFDLRNQLNRAVQAYRQPGSAFKVFVYGAGIESGAITASTSFFDVSADDMEPHRGWRPRNYDKKSRGLVRVRPALALSLNTIAVKTYERVGGDRIARFASKLMGLTTDRFKVDPTLALGTSEVTPLEMARGVAVYANGGREVKPHCICYILDRNGRKIYDAAESSKSKPRQLVSPGVAFIMTSLLREVIESGTASYAVRKNAGFRLPAAGKTGTNTAFRDAWFVGYTPDLAAAVWIGCDVPKFSLGHAQSGAHSAAPIWGNFMREVYRFRKRQKFPSMPAGVIMRSVCGVTGNLPSPSCPVVTEYFLKGHGPSARCSGSHQEDETI